MSEQEQPHPIACIITREDLAEHARCVAYWKRQLERDSLHAQRMISRFQEWLDKRRRHIDGRLAYHEDGIRQYLHLSKQKSVATAYGRVTLAKPSKRVEVNDFEQLMGWIKENLGGPEQTNLVSVKVSPSKTNIDAYIKETGEIPRGVDLVEGVPGLRLTLDLDEEDVPELAFESLPEEEAGQPIAA